MWAEEEMNRWKQSEHAATEAEHPSVVRIHCRWVQYNSSSERPLGCVW
jgi:hypothetical protein